FVSLAESSIEAMEAARPGTAKRITLVVGDITAPGLGLGASVAKALRERLTGCYHLAAVYDIAVSRELGMRINVEGTRNVLELLSEAPRLSASYRSTSSSRRSRASRPGTARSARRIT